jgi:hypothetical protein
MAVPADDPGTSTRTGDRLKIADATGLGDRRIDAGGNCFGERFHPRADDRTDQAAYGWISRTHLP